MKQILVVALMCLATDGWTQPNVRMVRTDSDHPPVPGLIMDESKPLMHRMEIFELETSEMIPLWIRFPELPRHKMLAFDLTMVNEGDAPWSPSSNQITRLFGVYEVLTNTAIMGVASRWDFPPYWPPYDPEVNHFAMQTTFPVWMDWRNYDIHGHQLIQTICPVWTCVEISDVPDGRYYMMIMFDAPSVITGVPYIVLDITITGFDIRVNYAPDLGF